MFPPWCLDAWNLDVFPIGFNFPIMPATSGHRLFDAARQRMVQEQLSGLPLRYNIYGNALAFGFAPLAPSATSQKDHHRHSCQISHATFCSRRPGTPAPAWCKSRYCEQLYQRCVKFTRYA
jgi:hypothetical protein